MFTKSIRLVAPLAIGAFALAANVSPAMAKGGDIRVAGKCSGSSTSSLKLGPRPTDHLTQVEWDVEHAAPGSVWKMTIADNGVVVLRANRTASATGNVVARVNRPGASGHAIAVSAVNAASTERCTARASD